MRRPITSWIISIAFIKAMNAHVLRASENEYHCAIVSFRDIYKFFQCWNVSFSFFLHVPSAIQMSSNLVQCIQDQASYYRKLKAELESESNITNALNDAKLIRQDFEKAIQSKKAEINSLEEYS